MSVQHFSMITALLAASSDASSGDAETYNMVSSA